MVVAHNALPRFFINNSYHLNTYTSILHDNYQNCNAFGQRNDPRTRSEEVTLEMS